MINLRVTREVYYFGMMLLQSSSSNFLQAVLSEDSRWYNRKWNLRIFSTVTHYSVNFSLQGVKNTTLGLPKPRPRCENVGGTAPWPSQNSVHWRHKDDSLGWQHRLRRNCKREITTSLRIIKHRET
jgi:hypothetical protein